MRFLATARFSLAILSSVITLGTVTPSAFADDFCFLPVCDLDGSVAEFKTLSEAARLTTLNGFVTDYAQNTDSENSDNLIAYADRIAALLKQEGAASDTLKSSLAQLLEQNVVQSLFYGAIARDRLTGLFKRLVVESNRYSVVDYWVTNVVTNKSVDDVMILTLFFEDVIQIEQTNGDQDYMINQAKNAWTRANARMIEIAKGPNWSLPLTEIDKKVAQFIAMGIPMRTLTIDELKANSLIVDGKSTLSGKALLSVTQFLDLVIPTLVQGGADQEVITGTATNHYLALLEIVQNADDLNADELIYIYKEFQTQGARFMMINNWNAKIGTTDDLNRLQEFVRFFSQVAAINKEIKEEEFMIVAANTALQNTFKQMAEVGKAPDFTLPIVGANEMDKRIDLFKTYNPATRFLLFKSLTEKYTASEAGKGATQSLLSIIDFTKLAMPIVAAQGTAEDFVYNQADTLLDLSIDLAATSQDTTIEQLMGLFKQMKSANSRRVTITYWGSQIENLKTKTEAMRLYKFFTGARTVCIAAGDSEDAIRDTQVFEQSTKKKAATLPN